MNTFSEPYRQHQVTGTRLASELVVGDRVHFPGTGLVKEVVATARYPNGFTSRYDEVTDSSTEYLGDVVLMRWAPPHNKLNWLTKADTKVELV